MHGWQAKREENCAKIAFISLSAMAALTDGGSGAPTKATWGTLASEGVGSESKEGDDGTGVVGERVEGLVSTNLLPASLGDPTSAMKYATFLCCIAFTNSSRTAGKAAGKAGKSTDASLKHPRVLTVSKSLNSVMVGKMARIQGGSPSERPS